MKTMIIRLMDPESAYGDPEFAQLQREAAAIQAQLAAALGPKENDLLQQLADIPIRQLGPIARDAFVDGFCTAVYLLEEVKAHHNEGGNTL